MMEEEDLVRLQGETDGVSSRGDGMIGINDCANQRIDGGVVLADDADVAAHDLNVGEIELERAGRIKDKALGTDEPLCNHIKPYHYYQLLPQTKILSTISRRDFFVLYYSFFIIQYSSFIKTAFRNQ